MVSIDDIDQECLIPWNEKYRPQKLNDVIMEDDIKHHVMILITKKLKTHVIITGPPGIGKTSTAKCIATESLGEHINEGFLELNIGSERTTKNMTDILKTFCKKTVSFDVPKVVLFDEADDTTEKCINEISTIMRSNLVNNTRFIFTCNDTVKLGNNIQSLCTILRFRISTEKNIVKCLKKICTAENLKYEESGLITLASNAGGDMRKAINNMQLTSRRTSVIDSDSVLEICQIPDPRIIEKIINACINADLSNACKMAEDLLCAGYCYQDILNSFENHIIKMEIEEHIRLRILDTIYKTKKNFYTASYSLHLAAMMCSIITIASTMIN